MPMGSFAALQLPIACLLLRNGVYRKSKWLFRKRNRYYFKPLFDVRVGASVDDTCAEA